MIIALYALAFAMILGGLFAAILGWDIVLVERGWTMVISGIIGASSGALLIGIASIVSRLARIHEDLARVQLSLEDDIETVVVQTPAEQARGRMLGDVAAGGGLTAGGLAGSLFGSRPDAKTAPADDPDQPTLPIFGHGKEPADIAKARAETQEPEPGTTDFGAERDDVSEAKVPDFLFAERYRETSDTGVQYPERETASIGTTPDEAEAADLETHDDVPPTPEPDLVREDVFAFEEAPDAEVEDEVDATEPPTVVGTYNSGDNKYVMYSDGSIEAETPEGFFRFASLDELKDFIASGGEGSSPSST